MIASFCRFWQAAILEMILKSLLLFGLAGLALRLLRRASAASRSLVCLMTLAGLLLLPLFAMTLPSRRMVVTTPLAVSPPVSHTEEIASPSRGSVDSPLDL